MGNELWRRSVAKGDVGDTTVPSGLVIRPIRESDIAAVGEAYFFTYLGTDAEMAREEAIDDIRASVAGEYGRWFDEASLGAWRGDELVGAILTVLDAPWDDVPPGPFIIDLFVPPEHRRTGVARILVESALRACAGRDVALRVDDDAVPARLLYGSLGFIAEE